MCKDEQAIEAEIQAKGLNAPRLSPKDIEMVIAGEEYVVFSGRLAVCVLTLQNGFLVTGESSCVDVNNFDIDMGREIARSNAREKIWALEGYLLRERLANKD